MRIEVLSFVGCPHAPAARELVRRCLRQLGLEVEVVERLGDHPSPTVLVNGGDVMGPAARGHACRLDLPTEDKVMMALREALEGRKR